MASLLLLGAGCGVSDRMDRSRIQAQEAAAIQTIRSIHTAETQYYSQFGSYAKTLAQLGPASGPASAQAADLIPADLASGSKGGYRFTLDADAQKYSIQARPISYGQTGKRSFFSDSSMTIHQNAEDSPASATSPELQ